MFFIFVEKFVLSFYFGKLEGKDYFRDIHSWEDSIRMDIKSI